MKSLSKILLALYLFILLWLVLFKFSVDLPSALADNNMRILNLIPFANYSSVNIKELIYNFMAFIPFGLFLSVNFKRTSFLQKLAVIFTFSLALELIQFTSALGVADITDLISNTAGGLLGLVLYDATKKYIDLEILDQFIIVTGTILLSSSMIFLSVLFWNGVRFQKSQPDTVHRLPRLNTPENP